MEITAYSKYLKVSPRKMRLVANFAKKLKIDEALIKLPLLHKKSCLPVLKVLKSAIANATNNFGIDKTNLKIKNIIVEEGMRMKRMDRSHGARFNRGLIQKRLSHVRVILEGEKK